MGHKNRTAAKVDANQTVIVLDLRKLGISVETGKDDILVGCQGKTYWFEIKNESKVSKKTGLINESAKEPSQKKLEKEWRGQYNIVSSTEEILKIIFKK